MHVHGAPAYTYRRIIISGSAALATLEERIDAVESRAKISELRSAYARFASSGNAYGVASLFTEDCVFDGPMGAGKGRGIINGNKALGDFLAPQIGKIGAVLPLISNEIIKVDGDTAKGWCLMQTPMAPGFGALVCEYFDECVRIDGKWYFAKRTMFLFQPVYEERPANYAQMEPTGR
ncbi:nuclear transport factor 2 family protein [Sphingomonas crocodyli]|uniref:Nuclear transport factor 2 family protein n=1 Tax=Sphingomonas crocodyli TaxID=1979270 RepID=A0A437LVK8_9SPHN|nr:nuclear transport factor 2 family protein [Sphingomonas crocodyli]